MWRPLSDPDEQVERYLQAVEALARHGFCQYEISNFAKPGFHSRHNCKYWLGAEYLGLGPAAHSLMEGRRFFFPRDLAGFLAAENPLSLICGDGPGGDPQEYALLGLRLCQGHRPQRGGRRLSGLQLGRPLAKIRPMIGAGYMKEENGRLFFTPKGFCFPIPFWRGFYKKAGKIPAFCRFINPLTAGFRAKT